MKLVDKFKNLLAKPSCYVLFQKLFGENKFNFIYINEYIKPQNGNRLLDIGCGPASIVNYLPELDYIGFDMSEKYIEYAQKKYSDKGKFFCSKVTAKTIEDFSNFDIVIATAILHHLNNNEAIDLFSLAHNVLKPGGRLITLDGCYTDNQSQFVKYLLDNDRGKYVRTESEYFNLANSVFKDVKLTIRNDLALIPYTYIIMECTKLT